MNCEDVNFIVLAVLVGTYDGGVGGGNYEYYFIKTSVI
jgi:hypothetical protein